MQEKKLLRSTADSLSRLAEAKSEVSSHIDPSTVTRKFETLTKPNSVSKTIRKVGVALIAAPDPITAVPGVALLATSFAMKKNEPATLANLAAETRKILRDIGSITL